jgi:hypothetical protein
MRTGLCASTPLESESRGIIEYRGRFGAMSSYQPVDSCWAWNFGHTVGCGETTCAQSWRLRNSNDQCRAHTPSLTSCVTPRSIARAMQDASPSYLFARLHAAACFELQSCKVLQKA